MDFLDAFSPRVLDVSHTELNGTRTWTKACGDHYLIYVYNGRGVMELDGVSYALTAGNAVQIPDEGTAVLRNSTNKPLRFYCVRFRYVQVEWTGDGAKCRDSGGRLLPFDIVVQVPNPMSILEDIKMMYGVWSDKREGYAGKTKLAFMNVVRDLLDQHRDRHTEITTKRAILECAQYIEQHYQEALERDMLAKKFSISSSYFSVLFKKYVGCTPIQYITKVRIEKAMELLKESNLPVSVVALEVGFNDPLYFTRVFSRRVGVTPRQFREA
jgi:Response regulator containing CheY-like receiver domain and AraC-type DNA-binding domain